MHTTKRSALWALRTQGLIYATPETLIRKRGSLKATDLLVSDAPRAWVATSSRRAA